MLSLSQTSILPLIHAGVVGLKCFMCPSGVDEFPSVTEDDIREALALLNGTDTVLAVNLCISQNCESPPNLKKKL